MEVSGPIAPVKARFLDGSRSPRNFFLLQKFHARFPLVSDNMIGRWEFAGNWGPLSHSLASQFLHEESCHENAYRKISGRFF